MVEASSLRQSFFAAQIGLFIFPWILKTFFQATAVEILVVYIIGTLAVFIVFRAVNRKAAENAPSVLGRP